MDIKETVCELLSQIKPSKNLAAVTDIVEGGYLDSFELMTLISCLCERFGIEVEIDDIVPENFNSVADICSMVERLSSKK